MSEHDMQQAVERFLNNGKCADLPEAELAAACDKLVREATQRSNREALALGSRFVKRARPHGGILYLTALRANGWAELVAGRYSHAKESYLEARSLLRRDPQARARIDRVLIDVYMYLGRTDEAHRRARLALRTFSRLGAQADTAKTWVNHANVLHRQDRHVEAGRLYRKAADFFDEAGIEPAAALCWYNLANTRVQLFDFKEAEDLYTRARAIFERCDDPLHATGCLYGMAWLHMLAGDFHLALRELSECEVCYREGKQERELTLCLLDRAESYLALNLFIDARQSAEQATRLAERLGLKYEAAKGALFAGRASLGLGRMSDARRALQKAADGFAQERNRGFVAAADLSLAQAVPDARARSRHLASARSGFGKAQLPLWQAVCDLNVLSDQPDNEQPLRRLARNRAVQTVPHLYAGWQTVRGDQAAARQRWGTARQHWAKAADTLDAVRAKLPPVEMRAAYIRRQADPFVRLIESEHAERPLRAAAWSERFKTAGIWAASEELLAADPERKRVTENLSLLASQYAAYSGQITPTSGRRSLAPPKASAAETRIQKKLRNQLAEIDVSSGAVPETTEQAEQQLAAESYRQPIAQFHVGERDVIAFVHHRGNCIAHRYIEGAGVLDELVALWRFQIECAAYTPGVRTQTQMADEQDVLRRVRDWLLPPLELPFDADRLLVIPEGQLVSLPWLALPFNGDCLGDHYDIVLSPSLRHHMAARQLKTRAQAIRIFVGSREGLSHLDGEVDALRSRLADQPHEVFDPCRRQDWPEQGQSRVWHFAGHATLRADNPFYSALLLDDGPLFAADFRLRRHRVDLVTLAACRTGQHTSLPGDESTGLVRSLLEMGARNVIASHWAVADQSTALWVDELYKQYLAGASVSRAVRLAARKVREDHPSVYHWGAFSAFGCG